jgi:hypothetical protein
MDSRVAGHPEKGMKNHCDKALKAAQAQGLTALVC